MEEKKSQEQFVIERLTENGKVSRNDCLEHYITRLAAIILVLKKDGWVLEGGLVKYNGGKDYVYTLVSRPEPKQLQM